MIASTQALYAGLGLLAAAGLLLIAVLGGGRPLGWWLRSIGLLLCLALLGVFAVGHGARPQASTVQASSAPAAQEARSVIALADQDGHFRLSGSINGQALRFMVDTGASLVVLSEADARLAGIDPDGLSYSSRLVTANGETDGAPITIKELVVGSIRLEDVAAAVDRQNKADSLLGASFLNRLSAVKFDGNVMKLTQ